jgi:DNA-directed RNA polymerase I subunit RPA2
VYRIQSPQTPMIRPKAHSDYMVDEYPLGTNAVVAVISYTGYDMEDAMIINKSAFERGFGHGSVYKQKIIDISGSQGGGAKRVTKVTKRFCNVIGGGKRGKKGDDGDEVVKLHEPSLGPDGLPRIGQRILPGEPLYCVMDVVTKKMKVINYKEPELCYIDDIKHIGHPGETECQKISLKLRLNRNPVIGDKFSSRHGQKGVLSKLWPQINMPFTEAGITPDIIINPHAFPSRMTIGMLIESMAGKAGACHGKFYNSSPFQFNEDDTAVEHFGDQLLKAGYNYAGNETMYSGINGEEMTVDIFLGVVYYQRLRHMVSDKSQVRATGPVNRLTRQPIKGRKVHGGIRFGEMERDSLIAHGASFLLHDRLMNCSDYHTALVCTHCGSMLSPMIVPPTRYKTKDGTFASLMNSQMKRTCRNCDTDTGCSTIAVPYVFAYLVNELAAMNIRLTLEVK